MTLKGTPMCCGRPLTDKRALDILLKAIGNHRRDVLTDAALYELAKRMRAGRRAE